MKRITAALLLLTIHAAPAVAQEHDTPCKHLRGQPIPWYSCMEANGLANFGNYQNCLAAAQAGLVPVFYCSAMPAPTTEAYPTGENVKPTPVYKECTPCVGMFALDPDRCTPVDEFSQDICDAKKAHGDDQVQVPAADVFHADGDPWQWHFLAAKKHSDGMEARALRAEAALATAKARCGRRCR